MVALETVGWVVVVVESKCMLDVVASVLVLLTILVVVLGLDELDQESS